MYVGTAAEGVKGFTRTYCNVSWIRHCLKEYYWFPVIFYILDHKNLTISVESEKPYRYFVLRYVSFVHFIKLR